MKYQAQYVGPGTYDDMHENVLPAESKKFPGMASDTPRLEPFPPADKRFGNYFVTNEDLAKKIKNNQFNLYAFNTGTRRFDPKNENMNLLNNKKQPEPLKVYFYIQNLFKLNFDLKLR